MQEIIENKKINVNLNEKRKNKEQEKLKKLYEKIEEKKKHKKDVITTNKIINLNISEKGNIVDINILDKLIVIDGQTKIKYDKQADPIMVMSNKEVKKLQKAITKKTEEKKQEEIIIKKTDTIISKIKEEMSLIIKEIDDMIFNVNHEYSIEKLKRYEKKLVNFEIKIEKLKRQYNIILNNVDFINFDEFNDEQLLNTIAYYKYIINTNEQIYELSSICKKSLGEIHSLYLKKETLNKAIDVKKSELNLRDEEYYEHQMRLDILEQLNAEIKKNIERQDDFIKSLISKMNDIEERFQDEVHLQGLEVMVNILLKLSLLLHAFKYNKWGLLLGTILLSNNVTGMNNLLERKTKKTLTEYQKLNKQLYEQKGELNNITSLLKKSLDKIKKLKADFENRFSKYQDYLPEYNNIYNKINIVIEQLNNKETELEKMKNKIETQHEKNKVKMKKMEGV